MQNSASCARGHFGRVEMDIVRRDKRNSRLVGDRDEPALHRGLFPGAVPLQLYVKAVAERRRHARQRLATFVVAPGGEQRIDWAVRPSGEQDEAVGVSGDLIPRHVRRLRGLHVEERLG